MYQVGDWIRFEQSGLEAYGEIIKVFGEETDSDMIWHCAVRLAQEFCELNEGHDCHGLTEDGCGWYVYKSGILGFCAPDDSHMDVHSMTLIKDSDLELILNG